MAAPTDSSLLSAELEEDDGDEALRRLLQVGGGRRGAYGHGGVGGGS